MYILGFYGYFVIFKNLIILLEEKMKKITFLQKIISVCTVAMTLTACGSTNITSLGEQTTTTVSSSGQSTVATQDNDTSDLKNAIEKPSSPIRISLGTSSSGGNFYLVGGGIATILNNNLGDYVVVTSEETGGSTANLTMIQSGEAELGIAMTSSLFDSALGEAEWTGGAPMDNIRGMIALYPSYMTIYSLASTGCSSISDLSGKIIGLGSKGAAMDSVLREALPMLDVTPSDIFNDGHAATATAIGQGTVQAAILFSYPPFSAITELEASNDLSFVGFTKDEQKILTDTYSFYSAATLPVGSYKGVTEDLNTVSEWNMLVCSKELENDYVYLMTKTILENNEEMQEIHSSLVYATVENCLEYNIPLHSGVIRYLEECGITIPYELIPAEYQK